MEKNENKWSVAFDNGGYYVAYVNTRLSQNYESELAAIADMQKQQEESKQKMETLANKLEDIANKGNHDIDTLYRAQKHPVLTSNYWLVLNRFIHGNNNATDNIKLLRIAKYIREWE